MISDKDISAVIDLLNRATQLLGQPSDAIDAAAELAWMEEKRAWVARCGNLKRPALLVYHHAGQHYAPIGHAVQQTNGSFRVQLTCVPVDGAMVLMDKLPDGAVLRLHDISDLR